MESGRNCESIDNPIEHDCTSDINHIEDNKHLLQNEDESSAKSLDSQPIKKRRIRRPRRDQIPEELRTPLRFGQCGNQLGEELFNFSFKDIVSSNVSYNNNSCGRDIWFYHSERDILKARAVLVDSESKVLPMVNKKSGTWSYRKQNIVSSESGGSGNNFALGYSVTGPQVKDEVLEVVRRECERSDRVHNLIGLGSCAGGTGSGAGSYLLEQLRDDYPTKNITSVLVIPYSSGEVVTQNNNILFTLSKQNEVCDGIFIFENDVISNLVSHHLRLKSIAFVDMNKIISQNLLSFLQPMRLKHSVDFYDILLHLCPQPSYKLLSLQCFPIIKETKSKFDVAPSWSSIERDMARYLKTSMHSPSSDLVTVAASLIVNRGEPVPESCIVRLRSTLIWPSWATQPLVYHQSRPLLQQNKCLAVACNGYNKTALFDSCVAKAWRLFTNNIYTHHYYKFGFTKSEFLEAFVKCEKILKDYKTLKEQ